MREFIIVKDWITKKEDKDIHNEEYFYEIMMMLEVEADKTAMILAHLKFYPHI